MKWFGYLSVALLLNAAFFAVYLQIVGKFPTHELGLAWQAIFSDPVETASEPKIPTPPEIPSYEDVLQQRLQKSLEIDRKIEELQAVQRAVEDDRARLDAASTELGQVKKKLEGQLETAIDKARQAGEQKLLDLVTAMKAKQAREVLISDPDKDRVLRLILQMDPTSAEKIFREFKQPEDQRILNGWLDRLGQGDPEAERLRKLMEQAKPFAKSSQ